QERLGHLQHVRGPPHGVGGVVLVIELLAAPGPILTHYRSLPPRQGPRRTNGAPGAARGYLLTAQAAPPPAQHRELGRPGNTDSTTPFSLACGTDLSSFPGGDLPAPARGSCNCNHFHH